MGEYVDKRSVNGTLMKLAERPQSATVTVLLLT